MQSRVLPIALLTPLALALLGAAPPVVFHSPTMDGMNPGFPEEIKSGSLDLYLAPGPAVSDTGGGEQICLDGSGDEICGFTVTLETTGGGSLDAFTADPSAELVVNFQAPGTLTLNRLNGTLGDAAPVRLGSLDVTLGPGDEVRVGSSEAIGASLQTLPVADNGPIATPEPGLLLGLLAGALLLRGLLHARGARS
jgi:hypothetical protein